MGTPIQGSFFGLDPATLASLKADYTTCLSRIAVAGQSYSVAGRSFTRANLQDVKDILAEIQAAITNASPTGRARHVLTDSSNVRRYPL